MSKHSPLATILRVAGLGATMGLLMYAANAYGLDDYAKTSILNLPEKDIEVAQSPDPKLSVVSTCNDGEVVFTVTNTDDLDQEKATPYEILRNGEVESTGSIVLAAGASQMIVVTGNGDEVRFETPISLVNDLVSGCK